MAGVFERASEAHVPKKLYSEALKERRRYEPNEAVAANERAGAVEKLTTSWNYEVVKGKWDVPESAKRIRKNIAARRCNRRSLENVVTRKEKKDMKFNEELQRAVDELKELRIIEHEEQLPKTAIKAQRYMPRISTEAPERKMKGPNKDQPREAIDLRQLWKEFVLATRVKQGWYEKLPKKGCFCGKARISYPHWPPTSEEEAEEQFNYCMNNYNEHRRNLVLRWWEHFNEFANMLTWNVSERQSYYKEAAEMIRSQSLIVQKELERSLTHRKRPKSWSCENYCDKVLTEKQASCLCHCGEHRDECPVHSY
jgi:hypothetical protein